MREIRFDPEAHRYWDGAREVPGVSHILTATGNGGFYRNAEWHATKGTYVHRACALWDLGTLDEGSVNDAIKPYLSAWKDLLLDTKAVVVDVERMVYCEEDDYAGILDRSIFIPSVSKRPMVLDIKSGSPARHHRLQLGGYVKARNPNWRGECSAIAYLRPNGRHTLVTLNEEETEESVRGWEEVLRKYKDQESVICWQ